MSETISKSRVALFASVATNIFLVAFVLGRFSAHDLGPQMGGHRGPPPFMMGGDMGHRPPPPMFGPDNLFGPDEMHADEARMRENFDKMDGLRKDFATRLESAAVSKDDVLQHFAAMDAVMEGVKKQAQDKAAAKISAMSPEERHKFARVLLDRNDGPAQGQGGR